MTHVVFWSIGQNWFLLICPWRRPSLSWIGLVHGLPVTCLWPTPTSTYPVPACFLLCLTTCYRRSIPMSCYGSIRVQSKTFPSSALAFNLKTWLTNTWPRFLDPTTVNEREKENWPQTLCIYIIWQASNPGLMDQVFIPWLVSNQWRKLGLRNCENSQHSATSFIWAIDERKRNTRWEIT